MRWNAYDPKDPDLKDFLLHVEGMIREVDTYRKTHLARLKSDPDYRARMQIVGDREIYHRTVEMYANILKLAEKKKDNVPQVSFTKGKPALAR